CEVAEGSGKTATEALNDALLRAVQQAIGADVDGKEMLEKGRVVQDIATYSNGYVESYTSLPAPSENGMHRVRILAVVRKGAVIERLKKDHVAFKKGLTEADLSG